MTDDLDNTSEKSANKTRVNKIYNNKYKDLIYEFRLVMKEGTNNKNILTEYNPNKMNDILIIENTNSTIFILLRNGTLISIGEQSNTLGRRVVEAPLFKDKLAPIPFRKKIIDISCGKDHVMAKTEEFRIFSWGNNFYGQLGIPNFPTTWESNKEEPVELLFFNKTKINQIKCVAYNSFAVTENNLIYGWGSNENGQLFMETDSKKISIPQEIVLNENFDEFLVEMDRKGVNSFIYEGKFGIFKIII